MEPITTLVSALIAGAAAALKPTAETAVKDAYNALKTLILSRWKKINVELLESDPKSKSRQEVIREDIQEAGAANDSQVLDLAETLLEIIRVHQPQDAKSVGVDLKVLSGKKLLIDNIQSNGDGVRVQNANVEDIHISGVTAGDRKVADKNHLAMSAEKSSFSTENSSRTSISLQEIDSKTITIAGNINNYLISRASPHSIWVDPPIGKMDLSGGKKIHVSDLRNKLIRGASVDKPTLITVNGSLFPAALLSCGWWDRIKETYHNASNAIQWRDAIQEWLFTGFDSWGPSWDFTWDFDRWEISSSRQHFIAQIGGGDEADSLPVFIPRKTAIRLQELFSERGICLEAEVTGLLGKRQHFCRSCDSDREICLECKQLVLFGGLLDYCLWLDQDNLDHKIDIITSKLSDVYSGYLWKCVVPVDWVPKDRRLRLNDLFFLWEHTNFSQMDAVKFCLENLEKKEESIKSRYGSTLLVQKSSSLVPGQPKWDAREIYRVLLGEDRKITV